MGFGDEIEGGPLGDQVKQKNNNMRYLSPTPTLFLLKLHGNVHYNCLLDCLGTTRRIGEEADPQKRKLKTGCSPSPSLLSKEKELVLT